VTTKHSPLNALKEQADRIAAMLKAFERGDLSGIPGADAHMMTRLGAARLKGEFKTGIVMDDKVLIVTIPWPTIAESGEAALSAYLLRLMREERVQ
jgi:hypothetical protein